MSVAVYIAVMAISTYLVRMIPFAFFRKKSNQDSSAVFSTTFPMLY